MPEPQAGEKVESREERLPLKRESLMMSRRTLAWTSTKTPATSVSDVLRNEDTCRSLMVGIPVIKITSRGVLKDRVLTLSEDKTALFCTHHPLKKGRNFFKAVARKLPYRLSFTHKGVQFIKSEDDMRQRYVRYIDIADIDAVEQGVVGTLKLENARTENRLREIDSEIDQKTEQIVSIIHHGNESLDVLVPDDASREKLVTALRRLFGIYHQAKSNVSREALLLRYVWYDIDFNRDGCISESEFIKILHRINFYVPDPRKVYRKFSREAGKRRKALTYTQVMTLLQRLKNENERSMSNLLWDSLFGESADRVGVAEFMTKFCHESQGEKNVSASDVKMLFARINSIDVNHEEVVKDLKLDEEISRSGFEAFLYSEMNEAYDPLSLKPDQPVTLDKPLSQYWINSSHNTYLTGDQLQSPSSVQCYSKALRRGCKCLELDVWDGEMSSTGEPIPIIYHGYTMTSKILFADVIRVVKSFMNDHPDTYPIILSLENHCSHPYQLVMARLLEDILGDVLYVPTEHDTQQELPSPEHLRGMVVVKGKRPPDNDEQQEQGEIQAVNDQDAVKNMADNDQDAGKNMADKTNPTTSSNNILSSISIPTSISLSTSWSTNGSSSAKLPKIAAELSRLTLFSGASYKNFEKSIDDVCSHMHSISENKIVKILNSSASNTPMWRLYNVHHMTRTYPAGARVDSSNYNPMVAWSVGCQLVALNFQTSDTPLLLNDGLFRQNDSCGYVLKPPSVLGKVHPQPACTTSLSLADRAAGGTSTDTLDEVLEHFDEFDCGEANSQMLLSKIGKDTSLQAALESKELSLKESASVVTLKIRILSGNCLPKPSGAKMGEFIDPYVVVTVHDVVRGTDAKATYSSRTHTTKVINNNGLCPVWNESSFSEYAIHSPDVSLVQFSVFESDVSVADEKLAEAVIPLSCLRSGYRSIQLYDLNNSKTGPFSMACLLVEIAQSSHFPEREVGVESALS